MDWFPLLNSLRIAALSAVITFFLGLFLGNAVSKASTGVKTLCDCVLTLPLVLPPTVVGFFLLQVISPKSSLGGWLMETFGVQLTMNWSAAILACTVVSFPLMYRTARSAIEEFDISLRYAAQTLGFSETRIFWQILLPTCRRGLIAGAVLSFARALGEYGATGMVCGYIPGRTATISTTVYQLWRTGDEAGAYMWVFINIAISLAVLFVCNLLEKKGFSAVKGGRTR